MLTRAERATALSDFCACKRSSTRQVLTVFPLMLGVVALLSQRGDDVHAMALERCSCSPG